MNKYRVRERDWQDLRAALVTAQSPQAAAEVYVECRDQVRYDDQEVEVVVIEGESRLGRKRHNIVVRCSVVMKFDARKPRDLQREEW